MRIALIARMDNSGLGNLCWEVARHLKPSKVLLVENGVFQTMPARYADFDCRRVAPRDSFSDEDRKWITKDVDVILTAETFYDPDLITYSRIMGVKTALITMVEMNQEVMSVRPDLFLCPSQLDYDEFSTRWPETKAVNLPFPTATDRLPWKKRERAETFIHVGSHGGMNGRKGTAQLVEAMRLVKSKAKLILYTWMDWQRVPPNVEIRRQNFKNYWQLYQEGDVLAYSGGANGISLPLQEAFSSGMGVLSLDIYPFNEFLPKRLLFGHDGVIRTRIGNGLIPVDDYIISPQYIAEKIDEIYGSDITEESEAGRRWAEANSWDKLTPRYLKALESI